MSRAGHLASPAMLVAAFALVVGAPASARADDPVPGEEPSSPPAPPPGDTPPAEPPPLPAAPAPSEPAPPPAPSAPEEPPLEPAPVAPPIASPELEPAPQPEPAPRMSEGRMLVSLYNSGFQWGIAPGVVFAGGKAGFALGLRVGYGVDTGSVIVVPGVRLAGYFLDPNVYIGEPVLKLVVPIDRFAPFVEAGAGVGNVQQPSTTGAALYGGGGFMIHFSARFALGAEANYQIITGTDFKGFGVGPILALGF